MVAMVAMVAACAGPARTMRGRPVPGSPWGRRTGSWRARARWARRARL